MIINNQNSEQEKSLFINKNHPNVINKLIQTFEDVLSSLEIIYDEENKDYVKTLFIGKTYNIYPSGKHYASWSLILADDRIMDENFQEIFETKLEEKGFFIMNGEGDPTDLIIGKILPKHEFIVQNLLGNVFYIYIKEKAINQKSHSIFMNRTWFFQPKEWIGTNKPFSIAYDSFAEAKKAAMRHS